MADPLLLHIGTAWGEQVKFNIVNAFAKPNEMWGVPIEIDPNTTGVMIAVDGTEMPLVEGY